MKGRALVLSLPLLTGCMALDRVGLGELPQEPSMQDAGIAPDASTIAVAADDGGAAVEHDAYVPESVDAAVARDEDASDADDELEEPAEGDVEGPDDEPEPPEDESEQPEDESEQSEEAVEGAD